MKTGKTKKVGRLKIFIIFITMINVACTCWTIRMHSNLKFLDDRMYNLESYFFAPLITSKGAFAEQVKEYHRKSGRWR